MTVPAYQKITIAAHAFKGVVKSLHVLPNYKDNLAFLADVFKNLCGVENNTVQMEAAGSRIGFVYTKRGGMGEKFEMELQGLECVYPEVPDKLNPCFKVDKGVDHICILRHTAETYAFKIKRSN